MPVSWSATRVMMRSGHCSVFQLRNEPIEQMAGVLGAGHLVPTLSALGTKRKSGSTLRVYGYEL